MCNFIIRFYEVNKITYYRGREQYKTYMSWFTTEELDYCDRLSLRNARVILRQILRENRYPGLFDYKRMKILYVRD